MTTQSSTPVHRAPKIVVLIPCFNEEATIGKVVAEFRRSLSQARIYVYDNKSTDQTVERAREAGALVRAEEQPGKGHVVRRMFSDIEADIYVMVDGDDTYDAEAAPALVSTLVDHSLDMVNATRLDDGAGAYRSGHRFGNWMLNSIIATVFGRRTQDMLSGYRVLSRRFVKSFPALALGFEIETELTVHALELHMPTMDVVTRYRERPTGSVSKLHTIWDGLRIMSAIALLIKEERPFELFSSIAAALFIAALLGGYPLLTEYLQTGLVPRFPTAILVTGLVVLASLNFSIGVVLATVTLGRREKKRLAYLQYESLEAFRRD